jgi:tetratricopeptide (TPR) repeat protein
MHFNAERFEEAIRYYRRIMEIADSMNEVLPFAMNNLIEAYESTKLYDAAITTARTFIARYPGDESLLDKKIKLGTLFTKAGYYDLAVQQFQRLLDEAGSELEAELRYNIGEAYYYKGDYQQAILEFLKVPYLVSKQGKVNWTATSLYMAGQSYEKISKFDEAIGMYQQIIDRTGIDATFKAGARKEIDRVKALTKKGSQ